MPLLALPLELQDLICCFIEHHGDLARLARTSKGLSQHVEKHLYRSISISSFNQAGLLRRAMHQQKSRAQHVRTFVLDIYDVIMPAHEWAARQLRDPDSTYSRGHLFTTQILSVFPMVRNLQIHTKSWPAEQVEAKLGKITSKRRLPALQSASLAFIPPKDSRFARHWDLLPWSKLLDHPTITELELIRAYGDLDMPTSQSVPWRVTELKSLRLLDCRLSHNWLSSYSGVSRALTTLEIAVTSRKTATFAGHMFTQACTCMTQLLNSLEILTVLNLCPIPRSQRQACHFENFEQVKELTVSASDLFGDMSAANMRPVRSTWWNHFPRRLEYLRLYIHMADMHDDKEGILNGVWYVLRKMLRSRQCAQAALLKQIILYVAVAMPTLPSGLVELGATVGVEVRLANTEEMNALEARLRLKLLLS